jgi:surfeit locus 1 family protein
VGFRGGSRRRSGLPARSARGPVSSKRDFSWGCDRRSSSDGPRGEAVNRQVREQRGGGPVRRYAGLIVGIAAALLFSRLGVWQLDRLADRRAQNAMLEARLGEPVLEVPGAGIAFTDVSDTLRFRRVRARGVFDFAHQTVQRGVSFRGAPGVLVLTPLVIGGGRALLVDRGWTYAADGSTADLVALSEPDTAVVDGVLIRVERRNAVLPDSLHGSYRLAPLILRRTVARAALPPGLALLPLPPLDEGPHLSYALQWFSFAAIALVGGAILTWRPPRTDAGPAPP